MTQPGLFEEIQNGKASLGIEFGSTRIKASLIDSFNRPIASGIHNWENDLISGIWTYSETAVWQGLQACYQDLKRNVLEQYGITLHTLNAIGISGMMHGYLVLDERDQWLVPFRTWRNTITSESSEILSQQFHFAIPQRWSIAHLYQAVLNREPHVLGIDCLTTLAGYVHYRLTGEKVVGIGEASGIFPIDSITRNYDLKMRDTFNSLLVGRAEWKLEEILPKILTAGENAGFLTREGALAMDPSGDLKPGIPFCPPEGDAGTGMIATNAITQRTGNVSAGTSVFAMIVLEKALSKPYGSIDMVTTPVGDPVAMVHGNNCSSDLNAWMDFSKDLIGKFGVDVNSEKLFGTLFQSSLHGDKDTGKLLAYNHFSGEHIMGSREGRPMLVRKPESAFTIANVLKASLFSAFAVLRIGMDVLFNEGVGIDSITAHGGLFKTPVVAQRFLASVLNAPITVMRSAGEGGPFGMAVLAHYSTRKTQFSGLQDFLDRAVFAESEKKVESPDAALIEDFQVYMKRYLEGWPIEKAAIDFLK